LSLPARELRLSDRGKTAEIAQVKPASQKAEKSAYA